MVDTPEPLALPPDLHAFLSTQEYALLFTATSDGAVLILKAPAEDIDAIRGRVPVLVRYELYRYTAGPIVRLVLGVNGDPFQLVWETFINPADPDQMQELADAIGRPTLRVLCYDEQVRHRLSKVVGQPQDDATRSLPRLALRILAETDPRRLDFEACKDAVQANNPLGVADAP
jgi:hypothetical protein